MAAATAPPAPKPKSKSTPKEIPLLEVGGLAGWRAWLLDHGARESEIWLVFWKSHTGRQAVSYEEAVREGLCHGWIDSLVRRLDDDRYAQKFTPRKATSRWSPSNLRRFAQLVRAGRMTPAGLAVGPPLQALAPYADAPDASAAAAPSPPTAPPARQAAGEAALPPYLEAGLRRHPAAWEAFSRLAPSHRRNYVRWIDSAKRQETRERRLAEAVGLLLQNRKLGLK